MALPVTFLALLFLAVYTLRLAYQRFTRKSDVYDTLPWVGLPDGPLAKFRARFSIGDKRSVLATGWERYSSQGKAFLFPTFLGRPLIILPSSQMQWIADQPEANMSMHGMLKDNMALDHALLDEAILRSPIHELVIRTELTRSLGTTLEPVREELLQSLEFFWGGQTQWHDINLWDSLTKIVARTSNRIFVGTELCRNQEFISATVGFAVAAVIGGTFMRPIPHSLRDLFGYFIFSTNKRYFNRAAKFLIPLIEKRMADIARSALDKDFKYEEPFDLLQWNIQNALKSPDPRERATKLIAKRYMATSFAAIHTTSTMSTNILFDIASTPSEMGLVDSLREEASRVYVESGRVWTKGGLAKLVRMDSVVRESMRLGTLGAFSLSRKVVAKGGLATEDGLVLPEGSHIAVNSYGSQLMDGAHYEDATTYDPFRFSRARQTLSGDAVAEKGADDIIKDRQMTAVTTGPAFLTFGHGRHSCPGRFFAVQELKLLLAQIVLNFDIQHIDQRPPNVWIGGAQTPPTKAKLTIRKLEKPLGV